MSKRAHLCKINTSSNHEIKDISIIKRNKELKFNSPNKLDKNIKSDSKQNIDEIKKSSSNLLAKNFKND